MSEKGVIVVTGSSGRIGTRVIEHFKDRFQCVGIDFMGTTIPYPEVEFVYVDLSSDHSVECAFDRIRHVYGNKITSIVHLAAFYSFAGKNLELYEKITVQGTRRLIDQAKKFDVEQFIFTSTMLVHDPSPRGVIQNEDSHIEGKWHYPASKARTEHLLHEIHGQIPIVSLRIAGCYDDQCNCVPISQHIARIHGTEMTSFLFPGDSSHGVPFIHFDDLLDQIAAIIEKRKELPKEEVFLCCEEDSVSYRDLQTMIGKGLYGWKKWPMIRCPKWFAKFGAWMMGLNPIGPAPFIKPWMVDLADDNYEFTMEKSRKILGWSPKRSLRETVPKMLEDLKKDPMGWYRRHGIPVPGFVKRQSKSKS
jgi:UDP-glucose 4-epimerase